MKWILAIGLLFLLILNPAIAAPAVTSSTFPDSDQWYSPNVMRFAWDEGTEGNQYSYVIDKDPYTTPGDVTNITENNIDLPPKLDGEWYFHIKKIPSEGTTHFKFQIDRTPPRTVSNTKAVYQPDPEGIQVTWNAAEDLLSGLKGYTVYRKHNESDFDIRYAKIMAEDLQESRYTDLDENFVEGFTYFYKIAAKDNAGNAGPTSLFGFATMPRRCAAKISISPSFDSFNRTLTVEVVAEDATITNANLRLQPPDSDTIIDMVTDEDDTFGFIGTADLTDFPDGDSLIKLSAVDASYDPCNRDVSFPIDSTPPSIEWNNPTANSILADQIKISINAQDEGIFKTQIAKVEFFYKEEKIKIGETTSGSGNEFTYDWDTTTADNGRYPLYAIAHDGGGNVKEISILISLDNKTVARQAANEILSETRSLREQIEDLNRSLFEKNVVLDYFIEQVLLADSNFVIAENSFEREQFDSSQRYATITRDIYQGLLSTVAIVPYQETEYQYLSTNLDLLFDSIGFSQHLRPEVKSLLDSHSVDRKLILEKVQTDANSDQYIATIVITFTNLEENPVSLQMLEVIPKELVSNASEIQANTEFDILRNDPIVRFLISDVSKGESVSINYTIYNELSKSDADLLVDRGTISSYSVPPLLLNSNTPSSASDFAFAFPTFDLGDNFMLVGGGIILLLLLAIVGAVIYFKKTKTHAHSRPAQFNLMASSSHLKAGGQGSIIEKIKRKLPIKQKQKTLKDVFK